MTDLTTPVGRVMEFIRQRQVAMDGGNHDGTIYTLHTDPDAAPIALTHSDLVHVMATVGMPDRLMRAVGAAVADIEQTTSKPWRTEVAQELVEAYHLAPASADKPVNMMIDFEETTEQWVAVCAVHGQVGRRPTDTADEHDEILLVLIEHDRDHHGGDGMVRLSDLARPGASPEFTRAGRTTPLGDELRRAAGRLAGIVGGMDHVTHWAVANVRPYTDPLLLADLGSEMETRGTLADLEPPELDLIGLQSPLAAVALSALLGALADDLAYNVDPKVVASRVWYAQAQAVAAALNRSVKDWAQHPVDPPAEEATP